MPEIMSGQVGKGIDDMPNGWTGVEWKKCGSKSEVIACWLLGFVRRKRSLMFIFIIRERV